MGRPGVKSRRPGIVLVLAMLMVIAIPGIALATAGDLYAAGTAYRASTYTGHRSYFGTVPIEWVADINANAGDAGRPVFAPEAGTVAIATTGWGTGYGNSIVWTSADGREQIHVAHLNDFVKVGAVAGGDLIAHAGSTGNSSGDHMHVSRAYDSQPAPLILSGRQIAPTSGLGAQYTSSGPVFGTITILGVVDTMPYYCPVTVTYTCVGVDAASVTCDLNGAAISPGTVLNEPGTYCFTVSGTAGGTQVTRRVTFTIAAPPSPGMHPVFRFYNARLGTHFYTASHAERDSVVTGLSSTFAHEGVAYFVSPATNAQPLHRFYNRLTGTHFYTATEAEKATVEATLGHVYIYEGPAWGVSSESGEGSATVWRFYNIKTGTHFYTADEGEKAAVLATLGQTFQLDGPAFWLAP